MSNPIDVEKDLFGHIAAAHLRTGNRIRMRSRLEKVDLVVRPNGLKYLCVEVAFDDNDVATDRTTVTYNVARDAVYRILSIHKRWRVPLGDVEFADKEGTIAVTWRHLRVRLGALRWILEDDGVVIAGILKEAENL